MPSTSVKYEPYGYDLNHRIPPTLSRNTSGKDRRRKVAPLFNMRKLLLTSSYLPFLVQGSILVERGATGSGGRRWRV